MNIYILLSMISSYEFQTSDFVNAHIRMTGKPLNNDEANEILKEYCSPASLSPNSTLWYKTAPKPTPRRNPIGSRWNR